jgi:circadian clock protein KaiC
MTTRGREPAELGAVQFASTGIAGLDTILRGGFPRDEMHLVQGTAGTGKTTLALQYLLAGVQAGESGLYITLSQTKSGLEKIARSHGWSLEGVTVHEVTPGNLAEHSPEHQTVLHTAEVELGELTQDLRELVEQAQPRRVAFDSIGVIGLLSGTNARYRREIVLLRQFLAGKGCTAVFLNDSLEGELSGPTNSEFLTLANSVILLDQTVPEYGEVRRRVRVVKVRGVEFESGHHNFRIRTDGLEVYPRLRLPKKAPYKEFRRIQSGIESLDTLLGGGLEQGTTCLLVGPPGTGKSTLGAIYARAAARGGDTAAIFLFEERPDTFKVRSKSVGVDLEPYLESGQLLLEPLDAVDISPGEFAQRVRDAVEGHQAKVILIDSLTGYFNSMGNTPSLLLQMHELLAFLSNQGVLTLLVVSQEGFTTVGPKPSLDVSYLSDSIILTHMFETDGGIRRCLAALKKRQGEHATSIREFFISAGEVRVGTEPLRQFQHILGDEPEQRRGGRQGDEDVNGRGEEP